MPLQCSLPNLSLSWLIFFSLKNVAIIIQLKNTLKWTEGADLNTDFWSQNALALKEEALRWISVPEQKSHQIHWNQGWSWPVIFTGEAQKNRQHNLQCPGSINAYMVRDAIWKGNTLNHMCSHIVNAHHTCYSILQQMMWGNTGSRICNNLKCSISLLHVFFRRKHILVDCLLPINYSIHKQKPNVLSQ